MRRKPKWRRPAVAGLHLGDVDQFSSREDMMRTLEFGGARGNYGFGRYPEGIFASVRTMRTVYAKREERQ